HCWRRALPLRHVARLVGELVQEVLGLDVQPRGPQLIGRGVDHRVECLPMCPDRDRTVATREGDRIAVGLRLLQREPLLQDLFVEAQGLTHTGRGDPLVFGHLYSIPEVDELLATTIWGDNLRLGKVPCKPGPDLRSSPSPEVTPHP